MYIPTRTKTANSQAGTRTLTKRFLLLSLFLIRVAPAGDGLAFLLWFDDAVIHRSLSHLQLGQITEMIHVASLIHDDVLDEAEVRRGGMAVHKLYSNKVGAASVTRYVAALF